jgi:hypothetical protein
LGFIVAAHYDEVVAALRVGTFLICRQRNYTSSSTTARVTISLQPASLFSAKLSRHGTWVRLWGRSGSPRTSAEQAPGQAS